jgi:hypothetical protein
LEQECRMSKPSGSILNWFARFNFILHILPRAALKDSQPCVYRKQMLTNTALLPKSKSVTLDRVKIVEIVNL